MSGRGTIKAIGAALKSKEFGISTQASAGRKSRVPGSMSDPQRNQNKNRYKNFNTASKERKAKSRKK